jgi:hypothetical protein
MPKVKSIFIAHPMTGDIEGNTAKVIAICKEIHQEGHIPIFPSFTWRQYAGDIDPQVARELAYTINERYFERGMIDEIWFFGDRMSSGMINEAHLAQNYYDAGHNVKLVGKTPETAVYLEHYFGVKNPFRQADPPIEVLHE